MKNLILVVAAICFAAIVSAQSSTTPASSNGVKPASAAAPAPAKATAASMYGCPKCDYTSPKEGKCTHDQSTLVKDHAYFCADGTTSEKAGKCKDGKDMAMMDCKSKMMNARSKAKSAAPASATPAP